MREFKKYWFKKVKKANHILEKIKLEFPEKGKEIISEAPEIVPQVEVTPEEVRKEAINVESPIGTESISDGSVSIPEKVEIGPSLDTALPRMPIDHLEGELKEKKKNDFTRSKKEEERVVKIKGAKPVDLGEDYPMIFFETDPFVLVFNVSHPVFRRLVEKGKLGSSQLAVLFERMFEAMFINEDQPLVNREELKKRWAIVDSLLKKVFSKDL